MADDLQHSEEEVVYTARCRIIERFGTFHHPFHMPAKDNFRLEIGSLFDIIQTSRHRKQQLKPSPYTWPLFSNLNPRRTE